MYKFAITDGTFVKKTKKKTAKMFRNKYFQVIVSIMFVQGMNRVGRVNGAENQTRCVNPPYAELSEKFVEFEIYFMKFTGSSSNEANQHWLRVYNSSQKTSILNKFMSSNLNERDDSRCAKFNTVDAKAPNQKSTCPWVYEVSYRRDRIPLYRRNAKCICNRCQSAQNKNKQYECRPIVDFAPVLLRKECVDGVYQWEATVEPISYGCYCAISQNFIPI